MSANTFNGMQRPGTGSRQPRPPSARTYHTDLFDEDENSSTGGGAGDVLGGGPALSASQKLQQRRELAAQKRRERQLSAGTVTRNPAATATAAAMHQPMRPRPPSGGGMPPPSAPLGANPYSAPRPNPLFNASSGGGAGSGMQQNPLAAMGASGMNQRQQQQVQQQVQPPAFDRHTMAMYAERRSFNISGDGHDNAPRVPDGQVRGFNDGSPHSIGTRGPAFEPDGVTELRRDLEAHGLADEFDPNEGRHPMEVAAERERTQRIEAAAKLGPKAKRIAERPKAARVDASDKRMFLMQPGPLDAPVQCHIVRRVTKGYLPGRNFPEYFLYLDGPGAKPGDPTNEAKFLLSARKRKKSKSSNYVISLDEEDMARQSGNFFAKLRSNFVGTEFTIYDKGSKPGEKPDGKSAGLEPRQDLGAVTYEYNVLGTRGPRKMKGYIPAVEGGGGGQRTKFVATTRDGAHGILDSFKHGRRGDMCVLVNKSPRWNEQMQAYCLNFNGRVTHASVKNFQLVDEADEDERVMLQFGKVGKDMFTMDFTWPMSALQAFAICLTSFDNKLACE